MAAHAADAHDLIKVRGARENNLRDVSVDLPKRRLTVFTGVSGSGKSSGRANWYSPPATFRCSTGRLASTRD